VVLGLSYVEILLLHMKIEELEAPKVETPKEEPPKPPTKVWPNKKWYEHGFDDSPWKRTGLVK
jgi:hypothetical protein